MTARFAIKPALLRATRVFQVTKEGLIDGDRGDEGPAFLWSDVVAVRHADTIAREMRQRRLEFRLTDGRLFRISLNRTVADRDADITTFYQLCVAVCEQLGDVQPALPVYLGEGKRVTWILFLIGMLSLIFGAGILMVALAQGVSERRLMNAAFPIAAMVLFGAWIAYSFRPWKKERRLSLSEFKAFSNQQAML